MRLTQQLKNAIVNAILADVPQVNYSEQAEIFARKCLENKLPEEVVALAMSPHSHRLSKEWHTWYKNGARLNIAIVGGEGDKLREVEEDTVTELLTYAAAQEAAREALQHELHTSFQHIRTAKQFIELFPEFEKYLPSTDKPILNNLVSTSVVAKLVEAGWPK